jgi:hypothetical protein
MHALHVRALFTCILNVAFLFMVLLLLRGECKRAPIVTALAAMHPDLITVLCPDIMQLHLACPAVATCKVHEFADWHLPSEAAVATNHRDIVHVEWNWTPRNSGLLPLLARGARPIHRLEGLDHDRGVANSTYHSRGLLHEAAFVMEVLDSALCPANGALVLEQLELPLA